MIQCIHYSVNLDKEIKRLRKSCKQGEQAIAKFEDILSDMKKYSCQYKSVTNKRTKKGEQRIKNCIKYDLGGGYRLVTIRVNNHLYIPFLGSHDETDQWFQRHRYDILEPDTSLYRSEKLLSQQDTHNEIHAELTMENDADKQYEEQLQKRIDESLLKSIFHGLFKNNTLPTT